MNGINEWYRKVTTNKEFAKKFAGLEDNKKIVSLAKEEGFNFTEEELMDLKVEAAAGGWNPFEFFGNIIAKGKELYDQYGKPIINTGKELYDQYGKPIIDTGKGILDKFTGNSNK